MVLGLSLTEGVVEAVRAWLDGDDPALILPPPPPSPTLTRGRTVVVPAKRRRVDSPEPIRRLETTGEVFRASSLLPLGPPKFEPRLKK